MQDNLKLSTNISHSFHPRSDLSSFDKFLSNNRFYFGPKLKLLGQIPVEEEILNSASLLRFGIWITITGPALYKNSSIWGIQRISRRWARCLLIFATTSILFSFSLQKSLKKLNQIKEEEYFKHEKIFAKYKNTGDLKFILDIDK